MLISAFSLITAFTLTYMVMPPVIHIAHSKNLLTEPGGRHSHQVRTPALGGIGIFAGLVFSLVLWTPQGRFGELQYILCAFILIFLIGIKDDIVPMSPWKKLAGQSLAIFILILNADVHLTNLHGVFGVSELSWGASLMLSLLTIVVITNGINLIDGINGLSASVAMLVCVILGVWFFKMGNMPMTILATSMFGSLLAFLRYNVTPAKIFMGDTGALLVGMVCSVLTIQFIESNITLLPGDPNKINAVPAIAIGILILPLFDTLRVFTTRIAKGRSPFSPDRNHIHHLLIDSGFTHMKATFLLLVVNVLFIIMVFQLQNLGTIPLLLLTLLLATSLTAILQYRVKRKKSRNQPA